MLAVARLAHTREHVIYIYNEPAMITVFFLEHFLRINNIDTAYTTRLHCASAVSVCWVHKRLA